MCRSGTLKTDRSITTQQPRASVSRALGTNCADITAHVNHPGVLHVSCSATSDSICSCLVWAFTSIIFISSEPNISPSAISYGRICASERLSGLLPEGRTGNHPLSTEFSVRSELL